MRGKQKLMKLAFKHGDKSGGWSLRDMPGLSGQIAVVTGANSSVGYKAARVLAAAGKVTAKVSGYHFCTDIQTKENEQCFGGPAATPLMGTRTAQDTALLIVRLAAIDELCRLSSPLTVTGARHYQQESFKRLDVQGL